jgi:acyl dehydratase
MIDPDLIGQFGPDFTFPVELGAVRKFAKAVHAPWECYLAADNAPMPPTFLTIANVEWGYSLERPRGTLFERLDHDLSVPLLAEEAYHFHGPLPRAGDRLTGRACLESVTTKHGSRGGNLTFLVMLTEFRDSSGRHAADARCTTVTTSGGDDDDTPLGSVPPVYEPDYQSLQPSDPFAALPKASWGDLEIGAGPTPIETGVLTMLDLGRYLAACGEDNPLHYDLAYARQHGFDSPFGYGMQQGSALASYACAWLGEERARSFRARFHEVFWPGDILTYRGSVTALREEDGKHLVDLKLACTRQSDGAAIAQAWMTFDLTA